MDVLKGRTKSSETYNPCLKGSFKMSTLTSICAEGDLDHCLLTEDSIKAQSSLVKHPGHQTS